MVSCFQIFNIHPIAKSVRPLHTSVLSDRTARPMRSAAICTSCRVFVRPKLTRMVHSAFSLRSPIASSTCDGDGVPELQADPVPTHSSGTLAISMSAGTPGNVMLVVPERR